MEILGWLFLAYLFISNAVEFFAAPQRFQYLYDKTARDVNFNKR